MIREVHRVGARLETLLVSELSERIVIRSSREFHAAVQSNARRGQVSVAAYARAALVDKMALDEMRVAILTNEGNDNG